MEIIAVAIGLVLAFFAGVLCTAYIAMTNEKNDMARIASGEAFIVNGKIYKAKEVEIG